MKKSFYLFVLVLVLFSACSSDDNKLVIKGKLENAAGQQIVINKIVNNALEVLDSAVVADDGGFQLKADAGSFDYYVLGFTKTRQFIEVIGGNGNVIEITGNANEMINTCKVKGSDETQKALDLYVRLFSAQKMVDSLGQSMRGEETLDKSNSDSLRMAFQHKADIIKAEHRAYSFDFVKNNMKSLASLAAVAQMETPRSYVIDPVENFELLSALDSSLIALYPESMRVQQLHGFVERQRAMQKNNELTEIGAMAPDISLPDHEGNEIKLSSLRGKWVLLDFWASWCRPCRAENPNLVAVKNKFKNNKFEIYQVSLDKDVDKWDEAIKKDNLDWIHVCDFKEWQSSPVVVYNIQGIPANFLISPEGKIVEKNLRGTALEIKLSAHIF